MADNAGGCASVAIETYTEQLESVQTAIKKLETSLVESSSYGNQSLTKQKLDTLYQREQYLRGKVVEEQQPLAGDFDGPIRVRPLVTRHG